MSRRAGALLLALELVVLLLLFSVSRLAQPYAPVRAWDGPVQFSPARAWNDVVKLATGFPRRWSGGPDREAAAAWLTGTLATMRLQARRETFPARLGGRQAVVLENVWAVSPGRDRPDEIVAVVGNYDMAPTSVQAASDTAGHVGTILELARVIHGAPHRRTFVFIFPDGEEWGMLGARRFARTFPDRARIVAALSIEDLDPANLRALGIDGIGQFRGFAPMWLRALAADAAAREGFPVEEVSPLFEWLQRAVLVSATDQGPFLGAGIPAIDLAGRGDDGALKNAIYHLPGDTIDTMRPQAVAAYGRIQERILRAIDAMPEVPRESGFYLRTGPDRRVPAGLLLAVQVLVFAPLAATVVVRSRRAQLAGWMVRHEITRAAIVFGVLVIWLVAVGLMPLVGLMPRYHPYPPPPRHPLLTSVLWLPVVVSLLALIASALAGGYVLRRLPLDASEREGALATALVLLLVVAAVALVDSPFGAVTFMVLPAMLWIWVRPRPGRAGLLGNAAIVAAGFLVLVLLFAQYGASLQIGGYILWYVFMALAYGQFTMLRVLLALAMTAVGLRLLALSRA